MLESLCLKALGDKPIVECFDAYLTCLKADRSDEEKRRFNDPKACVQAYLASRAPIVSTLGLGAQKGYWDLSHPCFDELKSFMSDPNRIGLDQAAGSNGL